MTIMRAREPFAFQGVNGMPRVVAAGDLMDADDPDMKGKEHLFEPVEVTVKRSEEVRGNRPAPGATETADAAPGSKRTRTRPNEGGSGVGTPGQTEGVRQVKEKSGPATGPTGDKPKPGEVKGNG